MKAKYLKSSTYTIFYSTIQTKLTRYVKNCTQKHWLGLTDWFITAET